MNNPIIILGAGASHDYSAYQTGTPLTNELVQGSFLHDSSLKTYPEAAELLSEISYPVLKGQKTFENALRDIKDEAGNLPHRKSQLVSLEFYLRDLFSNLSAHTHSLNNYKTLVNKIRDYNKGQACVVTLNYDTLFEESAGMTYWLEMNDSITGPIKLIKLHGSHDWAYIQNHSYLNLENTTYKNEYDFYKANPDYLQDLRNRQAEPYRLRFLNGIKREEPFYKFPAIAIPLPDKAELYICPKSHVDTLIKNLETTDRILIIGWRAADQNLVDLIKEKIKQHVLVTIVSRTLESAEQIKGNLQHIPNLSFEVYGQGFSSFVSGDGIKNFFTQKVPIETNLPVKTPVV
ncbi:MAG: hypothetical protein M1383_05890 [Patescibacteria group bacterium]|nr:hypothetical protein [Patescibacteria group bacterium]